MFLHFVGLKIFKVTFLEFFLRKRKFVAFYEPESIPHKKYFHIKPENIPHKAGS